MLDWLSGRYGFRGSWLIAVGIMWLFIGGSALLTPTAPRPWVLYELAPPIVQAWAWWVSGAVALVMGLRGRNQEDWLGHVALFLIVMVRTLCFAFSWLLWIGSSALHHAGFGTHVIGWSAGWYAALIWSFFALVLRVVASWPNPDRPIPHPPTAVIEGD